MNTGPVYAGGGYTPLVQAIRLGTSAVEEILAECPEAVNEVTTGGATPLHMCGMSQKNQLMTAILIEKGGDMYVISIVHQLDLILCFPLLTNPFFPHTLSVLPNPVKLLTPTGIVHCIVWLPIT